MAASPVVFQSGRSTRREIVPKLAPGTAWDILGYIGLTFAVAGVVDIALGWFPPLFGSPEWEFGTVTATLNTMPLPTLGMLLVLASALATGSRWKARVASVALVATAILLLAMGALYITVVPVALRAVDNAVVSTGLLKAVIKAVSLLILLPILLLWSAFRGWKESRS